MGDNLVVIYREKVKPSWKTAFWSAFVLGLLVHIYKFTNMLPNWDGMHNFYNSQNMVATGRWFLPVACSISSWYDLPWLNGLLSLVYIGITAAMVAEVFHMENPCLVILSSGLLVSFPAITATMAYEYTADGYMLAMVLASLSVCLTRINVLGGGTHWRKAVVSSLCICLCCGIYQAYVSFAFVLALCYFMSELLENRWDDKLYYKWIGTQILVYGCALAVYYVVWKLCLFFEGVETSTYQGLNEIGFMGIEGLGKALFRILKEFALFFLEWNILDHGITVYSALGMAFLAAFAIGLLTAVHRSGCRKRWGHFVLILLCTAALPVGCYIFYLTSPSVYYYVLMLQSVCVLYIFAAVLYERWFKLRASNLALLLLATVVFHNSVIANITYTRMDQCMKRTQAVATEISTRVHMLDDGTIRYLVFCGGLEDWGQEEFFTSGELRELGPYKSLDRTLLSPMFLSTYMDFELTYYKTQGIEYPVMEFGPELPAPSDWQFRFPMPGLEERETLIQTDEVQAMPVWPHKDSVQVIGDTVVVKLSQPEAVAAEPEM